VSVLRAVKRGQLGLRLLAGDAAPQPPEDAHALIAVGPKLFAARRDEPPHVGRVGIEREPRRHDADHRARALIQREAAADDIGAGRQRAPPEAMREDDRASPRQIGRLEGSTDRRRHTEDREQLDARGNREHDLRVARAGQDLLARRPRGGRELVEAGTVPPPRVEVVERREDLGEAAVFHVAVPDGDEPVDVGVRQRLDQHGLDDAEDRGRRADAERERDDRHRRDAGRPAPGPESETHVAADVAQPRNGVGIARSIFRGREVAEAPARREHRFVGGHAAARVLVDQLLEVEPGLFVEGFIDPGLEQRAAKPAKPSHADLSREPEDFANGPGDAIPPLLLFGEPARAGRRDAVEPRPPIACGRLPAGGDPPGMLHSMQRRVQRSFLDAQSVAGNLLNSRGDAVAVVRLEAEDLEDEQVERALQRVGIPAGSAHTLDVYAL